MSQTQDSFLVIYTNFINYSSLFKTSWHFRGILSTHHSSVICQTHDRSTASSKTIAPLNAI
jgi:hypothetical protein